MKGRLPNVPKRFREPGNTDEEVNKMQAKKKRSEKKELKSKIAEAHSINIQYLVDEMNVQTSSKGTSSVEGSTLVSTAAETPFLLIEDTLASIEKDPSPVVASKLYLPSTARSSPEVTSTEEPALIVVPSTPTTIHYIAKNSYVSPEVELPSVLVSANSMPPTEQQPPAAITEISFDLSSLDVPYVDIINELMAEGTSADQNMFEVQLANIYLLSLVENMRFSR